MASLELHNLTKRFDDGSFALQDLSLSVNDGELMVIVGPSGSGKTTLLRIIAGLDMPTAGDIAIGGRAAGGLSPRDRDIAMVFQHPALYPNMTVFANIAFPLKMRHIARDEIALRVRATAAMLGIESLLARMPATLSGGQAQRVALAKALVRKPALCLLDEPLSSLDPALRTSARAELRCLQRQLRTTTVYVTHDQSEAMTLGDRIAVIAGGRLQQLAAPLEIYDHPANRFVASFFGSPPMNFFDGTISMLHGAPNLLLSDSVSTPLPLRFAPLSQRNINAGLRPEHLSVRPFPGAAAIPAAVTLLEPLGDRTILYSQTKAGQPLTAVITPHEDGDSLAPGSPVRLYFAPDNIRLFDPENAGAILDP
jgi:ABC-type sugar transport system ATPase subunit